ncbi:hypothetical protein M0802_011484 [Mischocyttarus mexicanus]|nr:hypothetical protein M0802_011484 [Mischocyttarus mexicanus]
MNRREDPLLRQHRSRLLQLAEATNIKPGRGSSKRRGQRQTQGLTPSNGGSSTVRSLQDIVRSDPGYTPNIEHLVFPERKSSNPNLSGKTDGSPPPGTNKSKTNVPTSGRSRLVEVFAKHYSRGSLQDNTITSRKNHLNSTSLDSSILIQYQKQKQYQQKQQSSSSTSGTLSGTLSSGIGSTANSTAIITSIARNTGLTGLRWLSQTSQSSRQHSTEEGGGTTIRGGSSSNVGVVGGPVSGSSSGQAPALPPRRVSPATDTGDIGNTGTRVERGPNLSIVHLCNTSDPWEVGSQGSAYSVSSNKSQISSRGKSSSTATTCTTTTITGGSNRGTYTRGSSIPSLKRHDTTTSTSSLKQHRQDSHGQVSSNSRRREAATNAFLSGSTGTSGELFIGGNCSRELSPVRWCDREVDGVYLGRSGWVQVQQRSLDENRRINYESNLSNTAAGNLSLPRRAAIKLADYHCSNSEPGKCPQDYSSRLDSQRPDYLALHGQDYESCGTSACTSPRSIPESFSPPSVTPIISPPPAFQDVVAKTRSSSSSSRHPTSTRSNYGKAPFLPRSNAIDTDIISPPPSPPQTNWSSLPSSSRKSANAPSRRRQNAVITTLASNTQQQQQQQQHYRMAQAKSLEDQSSSRRSQFAQRYMESSSSSSSSMGFRSLDSCVTRSAMPRLAENTDSSVEGYEDGDEDDNPSSSLNLSLVSSPIAALNSSTESIRANGERISPSNRQTSRHHHGRTQQGLRRSPGSSESGKQLSFNSPSSSSSSSSSSIERQGRSPTPNHFHSRRGNVSRQHQSARTSQTSPDSLQSRVRRSRSLQLPEKRSPSTAPQLVRDHSRETNESSTTSHRLMIKLPTERVNERNKRYTLQNRKVQSTDDALNNELFREAEAVTEYLYGTRSRVVTHFSVSPDTKLRCNSSTCDFWPHCSQRNTIYSPNQGPPPPVFMKVSQSYPAHQRLSTDTVGHTNRGSACSSPASLERMDDRDYRERESSRKNRTSREHSNLNVQRYQERPPKSVLKQPNQNRWSPLEENNANGSLDKRMIDRQRVYKKSEKLISSFEMCEKDRKVSPVQGGKNLNRSPSGPPPIVSPSSTSSSSSSDIWVTTSDRTVTKSPRNVKSSGTSTPMDDAVIGSLKTLMVPPKDGMLSRPGSAPTRGEDSLTTDVTLDPHQRSLSLPKSFLTHNTDRERGFYSGIKFIELPGGVGSSSGSGDGGGGGGGGALGKRISR